MMKRSVISISLFAGILFSGSLRAQDTRAQYPKFMSNSYFGVNIGYIDYPFGSYSLEPGYTVETVQVPHVAVRLMLIGHQFNKNLSAQVSYMRPVNWVQYKSINGDHRSHSVWMNVGGLTVRQRIHLAGKLYTYAEAGLGVVTRSGFKVNNVPVVKDASYASILLGTGLQYQINQKWGLLLSGTWSPKTDKAKQPRTLFLSAGFNYYLRPLSAERVKRNSSETTGNHFPHQLIQAGYSTNAFGYGINHFVSEGAIPIFWGGDAVVKSGIHLNYQRNVYHSRRVFALDWGTSLGIWTSRRDGQHFFAVSVYPLMRFTFLRSKSADFFFNYSVAGPSYISKVIIDGAETGKHFTFQDFMGAGMFAGKERKFNAELRIGHYSNGNVFSQNAGVKVPLTFNLGYAF